MEENVIGNKNRIFKLIKDFGYNILATVIVTVILQIIIYPKLAEMLESEIYGQILTIIGIVNIITVSLGGALNNVRLIQNEKYEKKPEGDFNVLLSVFSVIGLLVFGSLAFWAFELKLVELLLLAGYVVIGIVRNYLNVAYRLKIDYVSNLLFNVITGIGYIVGLYFAKYLDMWILSFFIGESIGLIYLLFTTKLYCEKFKITGLFKDTTVKYLILIVTTIIGNAIIYLDRLILYPLLGGEQVTIYTVSSFVGKIIGLVVTPIAGVLLSYYAQNSFKMNLKKYWIINILILVLGFFAGIISIVVAPFAMGLLYPDVVNEAMKYMIIATVATVIGVLSNVINPSVMKYANIYWQIVIQVVYAAMYFCLGILLLNKGGLYGFCIAALIANIFRLVLFMVIGHAGIFKSEKELVKHNDER